MQPLSCTILELYLHMSYVTKSRSNLPRRRLATIGNAAAEEPTALGAPHGAYQSPPPQCRWPTRIACLEGPGPGRRPPGWPGNLGDEPARGPGEIFDRVIPKPRAMSKFLELAQQALSVGKCATSLRRAGLWRPRCLCHRSYARREATIGGHKPVGQEGTKRPQVADPLSRPSPRS
jgi:hypothetical protein